MISVVILAGGRSSRFGSNKLLADLNGLPLVMHTALRLQKAGGFDVTVVTCHEEIKQLCEEAGVACLFSELCREGLSGSVRAAAQHLTGAGCASAVFCGGDQPFLTAQTVQAFYDAWQQSGKGLATCLAHCAVTNPAGFSARYFPALTALEGDRGGRAVLQAHAEDCFVYPLTDPGEAADIDVPEQLEEARRGGRAK